MNNGIYSLVSAERLHDVLATLQAFVDLPIQLIDTEGGVLQTLGGQSSYCVLLRQYVTAEHSCVQLHAQAGHRAQEIGEAYIFSCDAQLNHIAFPLSHGGTLLATVLLGPFLMDTPDSTLVGEVAEKHRLPPAVALELYDESNSLRVLPPPRVQQLKHLVEHLLSPLLTGEQATLRRSQERLSQQSRINEHLQLFKETGLHASATDFLQKEKEWLTQVRVGNRRQVKKQLEQLLAYILYTEGGVTDTARMRTVELAVQLSRVTIEGGAAAESTLETARRTTELLLRAANADALCQPLQDMTQACLDAVLYEKDKGNHYVRRALSFVGERYNEPLTLSDVAEYLGISPNYLSTLFHQTTGVSFRDHLCQVRVEAGKRLLLSTDLSLVEIAVAVGFPDQSYFCKVFKKHVGLTPGKFRS